MPFPNIGNCIIADDFRAEVGNKGSILGYLGISPYVDIILDSANVTLHELAFILLGDSGDAGNYSMSFTITSEDGSIIAQNTPVPTNIPDDDTRKNFVFKVRDLIFVTVGSYHFTLLKT